MRAAPLALALMLAGPALAQDSAGVDDMMAACAPISASSGSIRADLVGAGWSAETLQSGAQTLRDLLGSHMWSFAGGAPVADQLASIDQYYVAFVASLNDPAFGQIYARADGAIVVLSQGTNLSCFWAGEESDVFAERVAAVGGFPQAEDSDVTTAALTQTVEFGASDWTRIESYAILTEEGRVGPYPAAARLDRSPVQ